jgi:OOP family OmpA-OmpF porin
MQRLRELINSPVEERIDTLKNHVENPQQQIDDVARVLPQAVHHQKDKGRNLAKAMAPIVDDAIGVSVRKNPKPVVDALYPIIGPAIRKSIASALQGMLQNFNRALEQSLSARSFKWRLEAMRTGQPFSEVVLMNTLEYQVEEVFLIHKQTGILLLHESTEQIDKSSDRDLVSGMLTAIKDFVKDSFSSEEQDELETFRVGQLTVLVEQGPEAILAVAVRGAPPSTLKPLLINTIEQIHLNHASDLTDFSGESSIFEVSRPSLQDCLVRQFQEKKRTLSPAFWVVTLLIFASFLVWIVWSYK